MYQNRGRLPNTLWMGPFVKSHLPEALLQRIGQSMREDSAKIAAFLSALLYLFFSVVLFVSALIASATVLLVRIAQPTNHSSKKESSDTRDLIISSNRSLPPINSVNSLVINPSPLVNHMDCRGLCRSKTEAGNLDNVYIICPDCYSEMDKKNSDVKTREISTERSFPFSSTPSSSTPYASFIVGTLAISPDENEQNRSIADALLKQESNNPETVPESNSKSGGGGGELIIRVRRAEKPSPYSRQQRGRKEEAWIKRRSVSVETNESKRGGSSERASDGPLIQAYSSSEEAPSKGPSLTEEEVPLLSIDAIESEGEQTADIQIQNNGNIERENAEINLAGLSSLTPIPPFQLISDESSPKQLEASETQLQASEKNSENALIQKEEAVFDTQVNGKKDAAEAGMGELISYRALVGEAKYGGEFQSQPISAGDTEEIPTEKFPDHSLWEKTSPPSKLADDEEDNNDYSAFVVDSNSLSAIAPQQTNQCMPKESSNGGDSWVANKEDKLVREFDIPSNIEAEREEEKVKVIEITESHDGVWREIRPPPPLEINGDDKAVDSIGNGLSSVDSTIATIQHSKEEQRSDYDNTMLKALTETFEMRKDLSAEKGEIFLKLGELGMENNSIGVSLKEQGFLTEFPAIKADMDPRGRSEETNLIMGC